MENWHELNDLDKVKIDGSFLKKVVNQTEEMCLIAVEQNPTNIKYVKNITKPIYELAIKKNGYVLTMIKQTEEICLFAVKHDYRNLQFCKVQTEEICLIAIKAVSGYINPLVLSYCKIQTYEICKAALKANPISLQFIDFSKCAWFLIVNAISENKEAAKYIPSSYLEEKLSRSK